MTERSDLLAAECLLELFGKSIEDEKAAVGALILAEASTWLIAIGRGFSQMK